VALVGEQSLKALDLSIGEQASTGVLVTAAARINVAYRHSHDMEGSPHLSSRGQLLAGGRLEPG
jgi:hypothetical protein